VKRKGRYGMGWDEMRREIKVNEREKKRKGRT